MVDPKSPRNPIGFCHKVTSAMKICHQNLQSKRRSGSLLSPTRNVVC